MDIFVVIRSNYWRGNEVVIATPDRDIAENFVAKAKIEDAEFDKISKQLYEFLNGWYVRNIVQEEELPLGSAAHEILSRNKRLQAEWEVRRDKAMTDFLKSLNYQATNEALKRFHDGWYSREIEYDIKSVEFIT